MSRVHPAGQRHADVLPEDHPLPAPSDLNALAPSVWPRSARREQGALKVGGVDVRDLAREYGTPLYVYDEDDFRSRCREFAAAFSDGDVYYAGKAFLCHGDRPLGRGGGPGPRRLHAAASWRSRCGRGFPPERITFHGNNKSTAELTRALDVGVGHIVLDSFEEIARLGYLAREKGVRPKVMIRVTDRRRGAHARVHRDRARRPEVRVRARDGAGGRAPRREPEGTRARRPALPHRLADLRHRRVRAGRAPGRGPARGDPRRARHRTARARPRRRLRHRLPRRRRPARPEAHRRQPARHRDAGVRGARTSRCRG